MSARAQSRVERHSTPGEAEEQEFFYSAYISDAMEAAAASVTGMRYGRGGEEADWFDRACWDNVAVALEQCCDRAVVLPAQLRETRLKPFSLQQRIAAEIFLREIPPKIARRVLPFIYWAVRIERAKRTGRPEFNPSRSLDVRL